MPSRLFSRVRAIVADLKFMERVSFRNRTQGYNVIWKKGLIMLRKLSLIAVAALTLTVLAAWSPWLTPESAKVRAVEAFTDAWESVADGCGLNCRGCGAISSQRAPFGALVTIEYACGMIPADLPEYHRQTIAFVSSLGTVHGLPTP